ncbi:kri1 [Fusarium subglutinans]|uniref:Kri1 n=1 Tax=Gibberella subglutinans TaxID=42677 RepID=A0A8H5Q3N5_GIBSU|nr:kri1 [Fusarium subglutinans]KAF5607664.1 kri1 [Fusarium subglutinans]
MGKSTEDPKNTKRSLLDDSDSESEDGGAAIATTGFKVNEDFARRFEHNKKREERQRLEEKFKNTGKQPDNDEDDSSSSSDEEEDEDGFLATEDLDAQISATLQAIRNKDPKVYDKEVTFYKPDDPAATATEKEKKEKPVYLKDYHREKYMRGDIGAEDADEDVPMTYNQEQDVLKNSIVAEMHAAANEDSDDEDGGFMKRKKAEKVDSNGVHPSRKAAMTITEVDVANADKNPETFLSNFMSARAWVPPDGSNWKVFESDEGEDDDDRADQFEQAYNLRFEDPERSNEFLRSYARDVAAAKSVRREEKTGRKRQRELERERKEAEKKERREEKARLKKLKLDEAQEKLRKIKRTAGNAGKDLTDEDWIKFLDDAWEDDKWEEEMRKRFGDDYYAQQDDAVASEDEEQEGGKKKSKHPKKPKWDDDIDIKDIIPDFEADEEKPNISTSDVEDDAREGEDEEDEDEDENGRAAKKRKTDHKKARKESQKQARQERAKLEALVDSKLELTDHAIFKQSSHAPFRYRETSPQSFGMTARDILLAPSDAALNDYAGLKKLATFRDQEKKRKDKKRLGKKARLRQWRREIFGKEYERDGPTYGFERLISADEDAGGAVIEPASDRKRKHKKEDGEEDNVVGDVGERKKKRKRSKNKKNAPTTTTAEE